MLDSRIVTSEIEKMALGDFSGATIPLDTMGSHEQGVRVCTSFFKPEHEQLFRERIEEFSKHK